MNFKAAASSLCQGVYLIVAVGILLSPRPVEAQCYTCDFNNQCYDNWWGIGAKHCAETTGGGGQGNSCRPYGGTCEPPPVYEGTTWLISVRVIPSSEELLRMSPARRFAKVTEPNAVLSAMGSRGRRELTPGFSDALHLLGPSLTAMDFEVSPQAKTTIIPTVATDGYSVRVIGANSDNAYNFSVTEALVVPAHIGDIPVSLFIQISSFGSSDSDRKALEAELGSLRRAEKAYAVPSLGLRLSASMMDQPTEARGATWGRVKTIYR